MNQIEKTRKTYNKILLSAIEEFGQNGYDNSSLNTICLKYSISKGLIYHNYKNKDDLYLRSVEESFTKLVEYLKNEDYSNNNAWENMKKLLSLRCTFLENYKNYYNIFLGAVLTPPKHLIKEINIIRKEYDEFNIEIFKKFIKNVKLRDGITEEMAISYFLVYQEMFNGYFESQMNKGKNLPLVIKEHDLRILSMLDVMIYGIVKEDSSDTNNEGSENI